ncbi:MAG: hypothetical protein LBC40_02040 [Dysgonamonadaceae bacterium]|jgi:hypothetical protein|nr:hypothetical protein [Dysgonamonadaceae bacterium]
MGGAWKGVTDQITCLSPQWDDVIRHTTERCRRLGLKFALHNSPDWAMSGGPWIKPENAMRHLAWSRTDVDDGSQKSVTLPVPQPSREEWRDYRDITVPAFPTPHDDTSEPLKPLSVKSDDDLPWKDFLSGNHKGTLKLPPSGDRPHRIEITFPKSVTIRTVKFSSINGFNHGWCSEPGIKVIVQAVFAGGKTQEFLNADMPQSSCRTTVRSRSPVPK